jgi:hypothetical protein
MSILELRVLPALAIARLGSSSKPLENFHLKIPEGDLDFRASSPPRRSTSKTKPAKSSAATRRR